MYLVIPVKFISVFQVCGTCKIPMIFNFFPGITCFQVLFFYRYLELVLKIFQIPVKSKKKTPGTTCTRKKFLIFINFCRYLENVQKIQYLEKSQYLELSEKYLQFFFAFLQVLEKSNTWKKKPIPGTL